MSLIQFPRRPTQTRTALLCLLDLQMEYIAEGRAYCLAQKDGCLDNCERLLEAVRGKGLPVAHFRQVLPGPYFSADTALSGWIADFRPLPNEPMYQRDTPSVLRNEIFRSFVQEMGAPELFVAGLTSERACLATVIDAVQLGFRVTFVHDASASAGFAGRSVEDSHRAATDLISEYCPIATTSDVIGRLTHADPETWQAMGG